MHAHKTPRRRNIRLPEFDYSQPGAYFVTIVTHDRKLLFGKIIGGEMILNALGKMVTEVWTTIPEHFLNVEIGEFTVMPNHIHGIISITSELTPPIDVGATHASPQPRNQNGPVPGSVGAIIGSFKSESTKRFHEIFKRQEAKLWQRNYYEHVIRNERDHQAIYAYILANPMNWEKDVEFSAF